MKERVTMVIRIDIPANFETANAKLSAATCYNTNAPMVLRPKEAWLMVGGRRGALAPVIVPAECCSDQGRFLIS
jgi:hypothetical protein